MLTSLTQFLKSHYYTACIYNFLILSARNFPVQLIYILCKLNMCKHMYMSANVCGSWVQHIDGKYTTSQN